MNERIVVIPNSQDSKQYLLHGVIYLIGTGEVDVDVHNIQDVIDNLWVKPDVVEPDKKSIKKEKSEDKWANEKFQTSMIKEAVRLEYTFKRESYKKEIRQPSLRKNILSDKKESSRTENICKSVTKKGVKCTNKTVNGTDYCGIESHAKKS
jgi:hypothetical protein